jgi:predicted nucleic acid-binding protein
MLLGELRSVLARPKFRRWVSEEAAAEFVLGLEEAALLIADPTVRPQVSRDPDDDYLVALAQAADAEVLVSGDGDLIDVVNSDPTVLSPRTFASGPLQRTPFLDHASLSARPGTS